MVVRGDTLGTIAARIEGREPGTIQAIADRILELNPTAFEGGDPTEMRLGARLNLPGDGPWMRRDAGRDWYTTKDAPIAPGSTYRVTAGDTLSMIAGRVTGRARGSIKILAADILAKNPHAFAEGNASKIQLGAELTIPSSGAWQVSGAVESVPPQQPAPAMADTQTAVASQDVASEDVAPSMPLVETPAAEAADMAIVEADPVPAESPEPQTDNVQAAAAAEDGLDVQTVLPETVEATADPVVPAEPVERVVVLDSEPETDTAPAQVEETPDVQPTRVNTARTTSGAGELYRLDSGDRVKVNVYGHEDLSGEFDIDGAGRLSLPLAESVIARGSSIEQLEAAIVDMLQPDYLRNPRVSVEVLNYRPFYIMGEVNEPGSYAYVEGMTVLNAIAVAGGFTYRARKSKIRVTRGADEKQESRVVETGTRVLPGDVIEVPERFF